MPGQYNFYGWSGLSRSAVRVAGARRLWQKAAERVNLACFGKQPMLRSPSWVPDGHQCKRKFLRHGFERSSPLSPGKAAERASSLGFPAA